MLFLFLQKEIENNNIPKRQKYQKVVFYKTLINHTHFDVTRIHFKNVILPHRRVENIFEHILPFSKVLLEKYI